MDNTRRIGPFPLGMDNRVPDYQLALPDSAGHLLRDALNVDVTARGGVRRRAGYALAVVGSRCHSLWAPRAADFALFVDGPLMKRVARDESVQVVASGLAVGVRVSFADVHGAVFWSNGLSRGSLFVQGTDVPAWGSSQALWQGRVLEPLPAGQHLCFHGNRLYSAQGKTLFISVPFAPHLYDPAEGFEMFPAPITMLAATEGGVYVGAGATYFASGGFPAQSVREVAPEPPVEWSDCHDESGEFVFWMSPMGLMRGSPSGDVSPMQAAHIAPSRATSGASVTRNTNGGMNVLSVLGDPSVTGAQAQSFINARIVRKEPT